jgi:hypothetical protein
MRLTTPSLLELCNLFELSGVGITSTEGKYLHGIPHWEMRGIPLFIAKEIQPWLDCIGFAGQILVDRDDDRVEVDLMETDERDFYQYRCPETFRMKLIPASQVAVHAVNPGRFLHHIADLLAIPMALRKGIETPAIDGVLWHLGKAALGSAHVDIWLARGLAWSAEDVFEQLNSASLPDRGLVLTTGKPISKLIRPPRDYRIVPLADVLIHSMAEPAIDKTVLYQCLIQTPGSPLQKTLPVQWDAINQTLTINIRTLKPWVIKGKKQAAAVDYLFKQAMNGRDWLPAHEILNAINPNAKTARASRMQSLFSGTVDWTNYITTNGKGHYGFKLA